MAGETFQDTYVPTYQPQRGLLADIGQGLLTGAAGAIEGIGEAATLFQVDIPDRLGLDPTETWAGTLVENLVQFGAGFGAVGAVSKAAKLTKFGKAVSSARLMQAPIVRAAAKGSVADFLAFSGEGSNLSNMLEEAGIPFSSFLAIDEDDGEFSARLKTALEGAGLGAMFDGLLKAFRGVKKVRRQVEEKVDTAIKEGRDVAELNELELLPDEELEEAVRKPLREALGTPQDPIDDALVPARKAGDKARDSGKVDDLTDTDFLVRNHQQRTSKILGEDFSPEQARKDIDAALEYLGSGKWVNDVLSGRQIMARRFFEGDLKNARPIYRDIYEKEGVRSLVNPRLTPDTMMELIVYMERKNPDLWKQMSKKKGFAEASPQSIDKHLVRSGMGAADHPHFLRELAGDAEAVEGRIIAMQAVLGQQASLTTAMLDMVGANDKALAEFTQQMFGKALTREQYGVRAGLQLRIFKAVLQNYGRVRTAAGRTLRWFNKPASQAALEARLRKKLWEASVGSSAKAEAKAELNKLRKQLVQARIQQREVSVLADLQKRVSAMTEIAKEVDELDAFTRMMKQGRDDLAIRNLMFGSGHNARQWWMMSLLSGFKTWAAAAVSGLVTRTMDPAGRLFGHAMRGTYRDNPAVQRALAQELANSFALTGWFKNVVQQFKAGNNPFTKEGLFDFYQSDEALELLGQKMTKGQRAFHEVTTIPGRILGAIDRATKLHVASNRLRTRFLALGMEEGITDPKALDQFVEEHLSFAIREGEIINSGSLEKLALDNLEKRFPNGELDAMNDLELSELMETEVERLSADATLQRVLQETDLAAEAGARAGFTNELGDDTAFLRLAKVAQEGLRKVPAMWLVTPFIKAPANMIEFARRRVMVPLVNPEVFGQGAAMLDYLSKVVGFDTKFTSSRWAQWTEASKNFVKELNSPHPDIAADAMGRAAFSAATLTAGYAAWQSGLITGSGPADSRERRLWEENGWQPMSLKVGDTYIALSRIEPIGSIFGLMASLFDTANNTIDETDMSLEGTSSPLEFIGGVMSGMFSAFAANLKDKSYLAGISQLVEAMDDPQGTLPDVVAKMAATFAIPNAVAQFRDLTDNGTIYVGGDQDFLTQLALRYVQRLPGGVREAPNWLLRMTGMPQYAMRRNFMGEEIERIDASKPAEWTARVANLALGIRVNYSSDDVINNELRELRFPIQPPKPKTQGIDMREIVGRNGQTAYDRYLELTGQVRLNGKTIREALKGLIQSRDYQDLPVGGLAELDVDSPRKAAIQSLVSEYRAEAREKLYREFPDLKAYFLTRVATRRALRTGEDPDLIRSRFLPRELR